MKVSHKFNFWKEKKQKIHKWIISGRSRSSSSSSVGGCQGGSVHTPVSFSQIQIYADFYFYYYFENSIFGGRSSADITRPNEHRTPTSTICTCHVFVRVWVLLEGKGGGAGRASFRVIINRWAYSVSVRSPIALSRFPFSSRSVVLFRLRSVSFCSPFGFHPVFVQYPFGVTPLGPQSRFGDKILEI